jgi:hypothetical protein
MQAKILEYEDGRILVTAEAYAIPELNAIIKKYENDAEPYLMYVHLMTWPSSPYINLPDEEKKDSVIFDIVNTLGDFDIEDELLQPAIDKCNTLFETEIIGLAKDLKQEIHKIRAHIRNSNITDDNMKLRADFLKDIEKVVRSYTVVKEQAEKELEIKMRGKSQLGDY